MSDIDTLVTGNDILRKLPGRVVEHTLARFPQSMPISYPLSDRLSISWDLLSQ